LPSLRFVFDARNGHVVPIQCLHSEWLSYGISEDILSQGTFELSTVYARDSLGDIEEDLLRYAYEGWRSTWRL